MKLLILTQKIDRNDPILGFFHKWIEEFTKNFENVTVICLQKGNFDLPDNVKVLSLGKENGKNSFKYIFNFYKYIFRERKNYDAVFVHMNPIYVVLGGIFWKIWKKKIYLWYVHQSVDIKLKIAEKFVSKIFTASKSSFLLRSSKILVVGHGIDASCYDCENKNFEKRNIILQVGRITKIKHCDTLIKAFCDLKKKIIDAELWFIGLPINENDKIYQENLIKLSEELQVLNFVKFKGSVPNNQMSDFYCQSSVLINSSPIGLFDKVVFEAMAAKVPVVTSNEFFADYFGKYKDFLLYKEGDINDLQKKIFDVLSQKKLQNEIGEFLFEQVKEKASIKKLIEKISKEIKENEDF